MENQMQEKENTNSIEIENIQNRTENQIEKNNSVAMQSIKNISKNQEEVEKDSLYPAYQENNVALLFAASENYMPYFSTMLQSILEHSSKAYNYDLIVFHRNITAESKAVIFQQCSTYTNFSVRFYNVAKTMQNYKNLHTPMHFTLEIYFRLLAPFILVHYDKILYLDSDMVVQDDVAKLYTIELTNKYLLAACKDADSAGLYNGALRLSKKKYVDRVLKLKNYENYFQAGTILFNLKAFRESFTVEYILEFALKEKWQLPDQDILNCLAEDRVFYVDMAWNVMYDWSNIRIKKIMSFAPQNLHDAYMQARKNPYIIHYAGPDKPWHDKQVDFGAIWWKYAENTPYAALLEKEHKRFKNRLKRGTKKILMFFANLYFPRGKKRRKKLK